MFQCRATSHGRQRNLMYYWLRVGEDKVVIDGVNSNILVISNVRRDYDGTMYQCGATNENGTTLSTIGKINGMYLVITLDNYFVQQVLNRSQQHPYIWYATFTCLFIWCHSNVMFR